VYAMNAADANRTGLSGRDLIAILFRRKWSILVMFITGMLAAVVWLWVVRDDTYELTAKVLVKIGYEQAPSNTILSDRPLNVIGQRAQDVNSEIDILQNTELLGRVVARLGLDRPSAPTPYPDGLFARGRWHAKTVARRIRDVVDETLIWAGLRPRLTPFEKVLSALKAGLRVAPQKDSNVFIAQMLVPVREGSSIVLNTLLDEYLAFRLQLWKGAGTVAFFQSQVADTGRELRSAEDALNAFENTFDINILSRQQDVLLVAISDAEKARRDAELALVDARAKWARLDAQLATDDPSFAVSGEFTNGSFPEQLMAQLSTLQRDREKLRMTELDEGVRLQNMKSQIAVVLAQIRDYVRSVEAEKQAASDQRAADVSRLRAEIKTLHAQETGWNALKRRVKVAEDSYLMYRGRLNEATGVEALETRRIGNVVVVERATDALAPYGVRKLTLLGLAFALVLFAILSWISVAEFFDHGVYTADALQSQVDAPVLAVVPVSRGARLRRLARRAPTFEGI
jgi:succinoglycan biosynthesis transport protein ExoP